jgi:predicted metallo-beta-lactamase superfamily hydrolase
MNIIPLAAESLGVRSSAVFIETSDLKILVDPGVSLAPLRFGLPPHPIEIKAMNESWRVIKEYAGRADVLIITHYHFDHFDPTEPLVFRDKVLFVKHPQEHINASQRERARALSKNFGTLPRRVEFADNNSFKMNNTQIRFSPAVSHGPGVNVGWVVGVSISEGDSRFLYTSDVQGACRAEHLSFIRSEDPDTLYLDGPLTYMMGQAYSQEDLRASLANVRDALETTRIQTLIIDHHGLRDPNWQKAIGEIYVSAKKCGKKVVTAAGFLGKEDVLLEAHRQQLFEQHPDMPEERIMRSENFHLVKEIKKNK